MDYKVSILIVNFNSSDFVKLSLYALKKLTKNNYQVFIVDNGSQKKDYNKLEKIVEIYDNVFLERWDTDLRGSMAHGTALNHLVEKVNTPYFSILDADATWLIKNWDEILINKIDDKVKVVGTQAPPGKPQDFPLMFSIIFETETFKKMNIDFRPKDIQARQDTGFEMREKYLNSDFKGLNINFKSTRNFKNGYFRELIVAEYYLDGNEEIFASHFGRGSTLGAVKYMKSAIKYFYMTPVIGKYFLKIKGENEKNKWIEICKKIINNQI